MKLGDIQVGEEYAAAPATTVNWPKSRVRVLGIENRAVRVEFIELHSGLDTSWGSSGLLEPRELHYPWAEWAVAQDMADKDREIERLRQQLVHKDRRIDELEAEIWRCVKAGGGDMHPEAEAVMEGDF